MKKPIIILLSAFGFVSLVFLADLNYQPVSAFSVAQAKEAQKYICPMHTQVVSDKPGQQCPICGMDLVALEGHNHEEEPANAANNPGRKILYWYDPMVPGKQFSKPGKSPFMDMELVPKYADEGSAESKGGKPVVIISAENIQKMGVRTAKVAKANFGQGIRAAGIVKENERLRYDLFSQMEGRVEDLKVSAVGDAVEKGQEFYSLYSPELISLQQDYITAMETKLSDVAKASQRRMKLLGVDDSIIEQIKRTHKMIEKVPFYIPANGVIGRLDIKNGYYLKVNDPIGYIQDLSTVWVEANIPEKDVNTINIADKADVSFTGITEKYEAKVDYIYPTVDAETRSIRIRLVVANKDYLIKPASYATVEFATGVSEKLAIPSEAILKDSTGDHVIMVLGQGKFTSKPIQTGTTSDGMTEIVSGLNEGDEVVTSSQFLIDSESSLRESLEKISMPEMEKSHGK